MNETTYRTRIDDVKQRAHGRWTEILRSLGVDDRVLQKRNLPCPSCGGRDRFQYTDKFGEGNYHCRHCGPGGGFKLLQAVFSIDFGTALRQVEQCVGLLPATTASTPASRPERGYRRLAKRLWDEAAPVAQGDEVDRYLRGRGLALPEVPAALRSHPSLGYYGTDASGQASRLAAYPAMLASVQGSDGELVTLHRTYVSDGAKAPVDSPKKTLSPGVHGAAVRLFEPGEELAVAEGIETALAVHLATGKPVWAALNAGNLEHLWLPPTVQRVSIYADNDADGSFDGQAQAYALARRLKREEARTGRREIEVFVPPREGEDWADVWAACMRRPRGA